MVCPRQPVSSEARRNRISGVRPIASIASVRTSMPETRAHPLTAIKPTATPVRATWELAHSSADLAALAVRIAVFMKRRFHRREIGRSGGIVEQLPRMPLRDGDAVSGKTQRTGDAFGLLRSEGTAERGR